MFEIRRHGLGEVGGGVWQTDAHEHGVDAHRLRAAAASSLSGKGGHRYSP
jgi:hypothetical protein